MPNEEHMEFLRKQLKLRLKDSGVKKGRFTLDKGNNRRYDTPARRRKYPTDWEVVEPVWDQVKAAAWKYHVKMIGRRRYEPLEPERQDNPRMRVTIQPPRFRDFDLEELLLRLGVAFFGKKGLWPLVQRVAIEVHAWANGRHAFDGSDWPPPKEGRWVPIKVRGRSGCPPSIQWGRGSWDRIKKRIEVQVKLRDYRAGRAERANQFSGTQEFDLSLEVHL